MKKIASALILFLTLLFMLLGAKCVKKEETKIQPDETQPKAPSKIKHSLDFNDQPATKPSPPLAVVIDEEPQKEALASEENLEEILASYDDLQSVANVEKVTCSEKICMITVESKAEATAPQTPLISLVMQHPEYGQYFRFETEQNVTHFEISKEKLE